MLCLPPSMLCLRSRRRTFRVAYAALASRLDDEHYADLDRRGASQILLDSWPYKTSKASLVDYVCHEEFLRIEAAWARAKLRGHLSTACRTKDPHALQDAWADAAQQLFPFPTATMLVTAAAETRLDSHCWQLLRELNALCQPQAASYRPRPPSLAVSATALKWQRDAVEGAGFGRTQRLLGRTQRATPQKLLSGRSRREGKQRRRRSLEETNELPMVPPMEAAVEKSVQATTDAPPPQVRRRNARSAVATSRAQALKEAPPRLRGQRTGSYGADNYGAEGASLSQSMPMRVVGASPVTPPPAPRKLPPPTTYIL